MMDSTESSTAADLGHEPGVSKRHKHRFHSLWFRFGAFGRQDVHIHHCFDEDCDRVVIGDGKDCTKGAKHWRETL